MADHIAPLIINPDHFLKTDAGRVWTPERSKDAWQQCFATLERVLKERPPRQAVVIVCGLQGAGKSSWIAQQKSRENVIYFDAALPCARHRQPIIDIARTNGAVVEAVWIKVPLSVALTRNLMRNDDERVPETSIRSVAALFEAPGLAEGFERIHVVDAEPISGAADGTEVEK